MMLFRLFNCRKVVKTRRHHHCGSSPLLLLFFLIVINCIPRWSSSLEGGGVTVFARQEEEQEEGKRVVANYPQLSPVDPWMQCIDSIFDQLVLNNPTSPHMDPDNLGNKHEDSVFKWKLFETAEESSRNSRSNPQGGNGREEEGSSSPLTKSGQKNPCGYAPITDHKFQKDIFYYQSMPSSFSDASTSRQPSRSEDREEEVDAKSRGSEKQRRGGRTKRRVISLVGDSTMNRFWMYTINRQLHPKKQFKVGTPLEYSPDQTTYSQGGSYFKFYKVRWASTGAEQIKRAILDARGGGGVEKEDGTTREPGVVIFALGAWDLQFNLQPRNKRSPGVLVNHNLTYALEAWSIYLPRFMKALVSALRSIEKVEDRPSVLIRDTWLPWCPADRFHKRAWRDCDKLLRPAVAPLYRRTLNSLAWSLGIPVIPVDPLFANNYQFCAVGDGIHLSWSCYKILQEVVWNSVLIVDKQRRDKDNPLVQGEWYDGGRRKMMRSSSSSGRGRGEASGNSGGAMMISDLVPDFLDTFPDLEDRSPFRGKKKSKQQEEDNNSRQQVQNEANPSSSNSSEKQWSYWPLTAFFNPSVYDYWSRGFRRKQPGGVDTHAIWLVAQKSDRVFWLKNGTNPPGKPPPWQPEKLGGHANYSGEIKKVEAWFAPPETGRLPVESGNTDRNRMPTRAGEEEKNNKLTLPPTSGGIPTASGDGTNVALVETKAVSITSQPAQQEALQPITENLVVVQTPPLASPLPHHSSPSSSSSVTLRGRSSGSSPDLTTYVLVLMVVGFAAWQQWGTLQKMFFGSTPTTSSTSSSGADHGED